MQHVIHKIINFSAILNKFNLRTMYFSYGKSNHDG